jgi:hypothetical protein
MSKMGDSENLVSILESHFGPAGGRLHTGVEVGTHRGDLSRKLLTAFPGLTLFMVDAYAQYKQNHPYRKSGDSCASLTWEQQYEHMKAAIKATDFAKDRRTVIQKPSLEACKIIPTPRLSFVFVDASHLYEDVRDDIEAWWPRVEAQGLLAGHDLDHNRDRRGQWGVRRAVSEFCTRENLTFDSLGSVWWIVKP